MKGRGVLGRADCVRIYAGSTAPGSGPVKASEVDRVPMPAVAPVGGKLKILLAEDNKINQKSAFALLGRAGYAVDVAENGRQAVDAVMQADYDVVLMDVQMPDLDGLEATKQIRGLPAPKCRAPIIALTAHAMAGAYRSRHGGRARTICRSRHGRLCPETDRACDPPGKARRNRE